MELVTPTANLFKSLLLSSSSSWMGRSFRLVVGWWEERFIFIFVFVFIFINFLNNKYIYFASIQFFSHHHKHPPPFPASLPKHSPTSPSVIVTSRSGTLGLLAAPRNTSKALRMPLAVSVHPPSNGKVLMADISWSLLW